MFTAERKNSVYVVIGIVFAVILGLFQAPMSASAMHSSMMSGSNDASMLSSSCDAECSVPIECLKVCLDEARSDNSVSIMVLSDGVYVPLIISEIFSESAVEFHERLSQQGFWPSRSVAIILSTQKRE
jgi:hypothetical protein